MLLCEVNVNVTAHCEGWQCWMCNNICLLLPTDLCYVSTPTTVRFILPRLPTRPLLQSTGSLAASTTLTRGWVPAVYAWIQPKHTSCGSDRSTWSVTLQSRRYRSWRHQSMWLTHSVTLVWSSTAVSRWRIMFRPSVGLATFNCASCVLSPDLSQPMQPRRTCMLSLHVDSTTATPCCTVLPTLFRWLLLTDDIFIQTVHTTTASHCRRSTGKITSYLGHTLLIPEANYGHIHQLTVIIQTYAVRPPSSAWLIYGTCRCDHVTPLLQQRYWLSVPEHVEFKLSVLVYWCLHGLGPKYLSRNFTLVANIISSATVFSLLWYLRRGNAQLATTPSQWLAHMHGMCCHRMSHLHRLFPHSVGYWRLVFSMFKLQILVSWSRSV